MDKSNMEIPNSQQIEQELKRVRYVGRYSYVLRSTVFILITVAAVAVLVATLFLPVLQIYGSSMTPSLTEGDIVVSVKGFDFGRGDIISFYYNNKILVKRVIAFQGEWVDIDDNGNVYVNDKLLDEPYVEKKAVGECDIELPYQVPDGKVFVCGDHRETSVDSRSSTVGCVSEEQIVGKIVFRVYPISEIGSVDR
jgi:signal peptidase I